MFLNIAVVVFGIIIFTGCASPTSYYPISSSFSGYGYSDTQIDKNIFRVSFHANSSTFSDTAEEMNLLRSAEVALKNKFNYCIIIEGVSRSDGTAGSSFGTGLLFPSNNMGIGVGSTTQTIKPSTTNTIACFIEKPSSSGIVYDAKFVFSALASKYEIIDEDKRTQQKLPLTP